MAESTRRIYKRKIVERKSAIFPLSELGNQAKTFSSYFLLRWVEKASEREKLFEAYLPQAG